MSVLAENTINENDFNRVFETEKNATLGSAISTWGLNNNIDMPAVEDLESLLVEHNVRLD